MKGLFKRIRRKLTSPFAIFLEKKTVFALATLFFALMVLFFLTHLMPSNPAKVMAAQITGGVSGGSLASPGIAPSGSTYEQLVDIYTESFGINEPITTQFLMFWKRIFTFNFGISFDHYPVPIATLLSRRLPFTLILIIPAVPVGFIVGNWIGSRAAYINDKGDNFMYYFWVYLSKAPFFWLALILIYVFAVQLGWFPMSGGFSAFGRGPETSSAFFLDALHHWLLPFISVVGIPIGGWVIGMRAMSIYEMESDYMQYSKQLGFSKGKLRKMVEENAILPNFTAIPMVFNMIIGQTLIVEVVFEYPGIGQLMYGAAFARDYPLLEATFLITVVIIVLGNFVCDIIYGILDPRIGSGYVGGK